MSVTCRLPLTCLALIWILLGTQLTSVAQEPPPRVTLKPLTMVTDARVDQLPEEFKKAWTEYLRRSRSNSIRDRSVMGRELEATAKAASKPAENNSVSFAVMTRKPSDEWLKSEEAFKLAKTVISYQTPAGGWSKAVDYDHGPRQPGVHWTSQRGDGWHYCGTLDNRSSTEQIRFLAAHFQATGDLQSRASALKGFHWLLEAQFPNGGWPQVYPLEPGYHEAITFNDDAMIHVLELLLAVRRGESPFEFIDAQTRQALSDAYERGLQCVFNCQLTIDGKKTVWCAQHDPISLEPVGARLKEPPSLSGGESGAIVKFLMREADDSPLARQSIQAAVDWFVAHQVTGLKKVKNSAGKTDFVADANSDEIYWARFYDLKTQKPIFAGAQDGIIYSSYSEMAKNNTVGYEYLTTRPAELIGKEVQRWKKRFKIP